MRKSRFSLFLLALALLLSCQEKKADDRDPIDEGYKRIDQAQYDGAIEYFLELQKTDPREQVRIALASAYAARAGVRAEGFWDFTQMLKGPTVTEKDLKLQHVYLKNQENIEQWSAILGTKLKEDLELLGKVMAALEILKVKIETLPYVGEVERQDLERGVRVLKNAESPGARLYSGALNLVILRSDLKDGFTAWENIERHLKKLNTKDPSAPRNKEILCAIDFDIYQKWISYQFDKAKDIFFDLKVAFPSKSSEFIRFSLAVSGLQKQLPRLSQSLRCTR